MYCLRSTRKASSLVTFCGIFKGEDVAVDAVIAAEADAAALLLDLGLAAKGMSPSFL